MVHRAHQDAVEQREGAVPGLNWRVSAVIVIVIVPGRFPSGC